MSTVDCIGLDVQKKTISFCAKAQDGRILDEGKIAARRGELGAHPAMLKAIAASKKKNDKVDARKIADLLRCDLLPECYLAPSAIRELRHVLAFVPQDFKYSWLCLGAGNGTLADGISEVSRTESGLA